MREFLIGLVLAFISAFISGSAKVLAKRLFGEKQKNPTLTPEKRNKGRKS